ncbi:hypothetical protein KQ51_00818 [Candidatus Izimaplasma bacterium HR1]|jgi:hypothetical protein|uniref:hypothetical protein n=1 Tax=Candidatus Izimoplasma sp. HR1 TaxID=1541959 RepID=UPI0004F6CABF|nr:hypothetical protein KQ51_00818 [Candidatus Izimaplasma bacterium HR1]
MAEGPRISEILSYAQGKTNRGKDTDISMRKIDSQYMGNLRISKEDTSRVSNTSTRISEYNNNEPKRNYLDEARERMRNRAKLARLEVQLLVYVFNTDDGKISFKERQSIKKYSVSLNKLITSKDMNDIIRMSKTPKSLNEILNFITTQDVSNEQISKALHLLEKICKRNSRYNKIILNLRSNLENLKMEGKNGEI